MPIVVRLDGTNAEEGRRILARRGAPEDRAGGDHAGGGRRRPPSWPRGRRSDGDPRSTDHEVVVQGMTGQGGDVPLAPQPRLRDQGRGRRDAGQGRDATSTASPCSTPWPRPSPRRGPTRRWSSCRRGSPPTRSSRRPTPASRLIVAITEGIPVAGHGPGRELPAGQVDTVLVGPNCPGLISPGQVERGDHPRRDLLARAGGTGVPVGHAHLPDRPRADPARDRAVDVRRDGRRPGPRGRLHRARWHGSRTIPRPTVVMVGEIGGDDEERAADYIAEHVDQAGRRLRGRIQRPPGKRMGHAGAIVTGSTGTAQAKAEAFEAVGVQVGGTRPRSPTSSRPPWGEPARRASSRRCSGVRTGGEGGGHFRCPRGPGDRRGRAGGRVRDACVRRSRIARQLSVDRVAVHLHVPAGATGADVGSDRLRRAADGWVSGRAPDRYRCGRARLRDRGTSHRSRRAEGRRSSTRCRWRGRRRGRGDRARRVGVGPRRWHCPRTRCWVT